jgi:hypothetical protein
VQSLGVFGILATALAAVIATVVPSPWNWAAAMLLVVAGIVMLLRQSQRPAHPSMTSKKGDNGEAFMHYGAGNPPGGGKHKSYGDSGSDSHDGGADGGGGD